MRTVAPGPLRPEPRRPGLQVGAHAVVLCVGLLLAFYLLPLDRPFRVRTVLGLLAGLICVALLLGWQLRVIMRSPYPRLQAVKTFAMTIPLFLILFATTYYLLERSAPGSFNQPLTRSDALYFTITVFSSVGFGDIVAHDEAARLVVTVQIAADLVIIGAAARLVIDAVREGRRRQGQQE